MHWTCRRRVRFAHAQTLAYISKLVAGTSSRKVPRVTRSWQQENGSPLPFWITWTRQRWRAIYSIKLT